MQCDLLRASRILCGRHYRRFQLSLDARSIAKLPDLPLTASTPPAPSACTP